MRAPAAWSILVLSLLACGSSSSGNAGSDAGAGDGSTGQRCPSGGPASTFAFSSENMNGTCAPPLVLTGMGAAGTPCQGDGDCAPTCCACKTGSKSALVAACIPSEAGMVCATADEACCSFEASPPTECQ